MPLEIVYGESRNRAIAQALAGQLQPVIEEGTVYLGYPVLTTADQRVEIDALLVSRAHGLVAFLLADSMPGSDEEWEDVYAEQDRLFAILEGYLSRHEGLREGRRAAVSPETATVFATTPPSKSRSKTEGVYLSMESVRDWVLALSPISEELERNLQAALQRVATIKPAKRRSSVTKDHSRGAILKEIESGIANLDRWQKTAAIESPEGPQRIRGLAGSGKTVVLALKAAYWHSQHPDWHIALTFHSRALYQQIDDLVTRFTFETTNDKPDQSRLRIVHSWGSSARVGVYSLIASALGEPARDWSYASGKYGMDDAFAGACRELLNVAGSHDVQPIFDAILIDEAQDLPPEFFQLVYLFTKHPKRIVWGYDELQKLSEAAMPTTDEMFGTGPKGESLISLTWSDGEPMRDIVLPMCYRNTPWALATAHSLGVGVYRHEGLLQHPDEPTLWRDVGYNVVRGHLALGSPVTLERSTASYPQYFPNLLTARDSVAVRSFPTRDEHDAWIASEIHRNLVDDELEPDDILVVLPDAYRAKSRAPHLMRQLSRHGIQSHLVGVSTSADEVFQPESVAIAHIYRAKGNEAPMVYAADSQHAIGQFNAVTRRNSLFTAITRSRAWVRITGWGEQMGPIQQEIETIFSKSFQLHFTIPTSDELAKLRHIHRDRPESAEKSLQKATKAIAAFLEAYERGELDPLDLPPALRTKLILSLQSDSPNVNR
ncbi:DEAD/DEAH box helicase [Candidatus Poriferisodalis sp.]|uniref:DEAD/DEAH box helicase n=1 Tax=Candidatus Poriferisodalis sp. TaxID=3101277 RepID=UPI003B014AEC